MNNDSKDAGVIQAVIERLQSQRLPLALSLKEKVDRGESLTDSDIDFLQGVFQDAQRVLPLVDRRPDLQSLAGKMINLYKQITDQALENEKANTGNS